MYTVQGLPFGATKEEIAEFFKGFQLAGPPSSSITLLTLQTGRPSGEAFVYFIDAEEAFKAQREKHMKFLGNR